MIQSMEFLSDEERNKIEEEVRKGYVRKSEHPRLNLLIFTYTPKCEVEEHWNEITRRCRGLVIDDNNDRIIINCIPKFFNYDTKFAANVDFENCQITKKEDGYLIQIKRDECSGEPDNIVVTSKGSFDNKYVDKARSIIEGHQREFEPGFSYICELLHDFDGDEGIIVTRHNATKLVCFAILNDKGEEIDDFSSLPSCLEKVQEFTPDQAKKYLTQEVEGVVLKNTGGERVKMKTDWFFRMHKLISNCTKKAVFDTLSKGDEIDWNLIPDEFIEQMKTWEFELTSLFETNKVWMEEFSDVVFNEKKMTRKDLALNESFGLSKYQKSLLFLYEQDKISKAYELIWKHINEVM